MPSTNAKAEAGGGSTMNWTLIVDNKIIDPVKQDN